MLFSSSGGVGISGCAIGGDAPRRSSAKSMLSVARNDSACCVGAADVGVATGRVAAGTVSMLFSSSGGVGISGCAIGGGAPRRSSAKSMLSVARNDSACCVGAADVGVATGRVAAGMVSILFSGSDGADLSGCAIGGGAPRRSSAKSMLSVARNDSACCVGAADVGVATGRVAGAGTVSMLFSSSGGAGISGCAIGGDVPRRSSAKCHALSGAQRFRHLRGRSGRRDGHGESRGRNGGDSLQWFGGCGFNGLCDRRRCSSKVLG